MGHFDWSATGFERLNVDRPSSNEVEICLFGVGFGECALVHFGRGEWMLIDSCLDVNYVQPALAYLCEIGFDPAVDVKLVAVSHWDADHVSGLADAVERCAGATFACANVLSGKDWRRLGQIAQRESLPGSTSDEYVRTLEILGARATGKPPSLPIGWCGEHTPLITRAADASGPAVKVEALSPSHATFSLFMQAVKGWMPTAGKPRPPIPFRAPNDTSMVLSVRVGLAKALFGGDLEVRKGNSATGWTAILNSPHRDPSPSQVFKVPHHGSVTGHDPFVWSGLLVHNVTALVAPWVNGGRSLPTAVDRARICSITADSHLAAPTKRLPRQRRHRSVEKFIERGPRAMSTLVGTAGMVRVRIDAANPASVTVDHRPPAAVMC